MFGLSRAWLFGIGTVVAVILIALLAWRVLDQRAGRLETPPGVASSDARVPSALSLSQDGPVAPGDAPVAPPLTPPATAAAPADGAKFDIVRVEPNGEAVVAGRATPNTIVRLLNRGKVVAEVKTDANGQFALIPPALGSGDHLLSLEIDGKPGSGSAQTVAVSVPRNGSGEVVVALAEPGAATRVLSDAAPAPTSAVTQAGPASAAIRTVEAEEAGGFYASGTATPGATLRLYLNGTAVAAVRAGDDGRWSLKISRGMAAGAYAVRADVLGPDGKVVSRAEVPFDYPAPRAVASADKQSREVPVDAGKATADAAHATLADLQSVTVQRGDSLWRISRKMLGSGMRYTQIYTANNGQIRDPSKIYPKQILVVPQTTN